MEVEYYASMGRQSIIEGLPLMQIIDCLASAGKCCVVAPMLCNVGRH